MMISHLHRDLCAAAADPLLDVGRPRLRADSCSSSTSSRIWKIRASRSWWMLALALAAVVALAGCSSGGDTDDGGVDAWDGVDAGGEDAGDAGVDAGDAGADGEDGSDAGADGTDGADGADAGGDDDGTIHGRPKSPLFGAVVFNEVLIDGTAEGDPNGDGDTSHPFEDQFVELVNVHGADVDLSGCRLIEEDLAEGRPRHTFPAGTTLPAGHALVIFGGGDAPEATDTATFLTANADDPGGLSFGLHLSDPSDTVWLLDPEGGAVALFCYGGADDCALPAAEDASLTRDPDLTGDFTPHDEAAGSGGAAFSPGTLVDGTPF
ncbi:MAG: lamin tail domain-containing protein [Deltaproteobacteria bacterium]|nr:lamin tail domain-containing protein [Deltaproteobacteria bacterium]